MMFLKFFALIAGTLIAVLGGIALAVPSARQLVKEDVVTLGQFVNDASIKLWLFRFSWPQRLIKVHRYKARHKPKNIFLATVDKAFNL